MTRLDHLRRFTAPLVGLPLAFACATAPPAARALDPAPAAAPSTAAPVQEGSSAPSNADLAQKLTNPIADMYSFPFQLNYDQDIGPADRGERWKLNVQPVLPFDLNDDWLVVSRTILPVISQDDVFGNGRSQSGIGDVVQSFFFVPRASSGGLTWGVGPVLLLPTASDDLLGQEKWGAGPTGVALKIDGPWTYGALANHLWSFAGDDDRLDVNATFVQPFLAYTTTTAYTFSLNSEATYDWEASDWSIPFNALVSRVVLFGKLPVSVGAGLRYWAESPDAGPEGLGFRFQLTPILPR